MKTQRILVLTLSLGSGHVQAARTIECELKRQLPLVEVRVLDALAGCRLLFRAGYVWPYWAMLRYAPNLWDRFFQRRVARMDRQTAPRWAFRLGCPQVFKTITDFKPDAIVATEVAAGEMAAIARREGLTMARITSVITDYEAEPVWIKPEVDVYAVADAYVRDQLSGWGETQERIVICGIPTDLPFHTQHDKQTTRARYAIYDEAPIVLIMGGGWGPTRMNEVAARLSVCGQPMHVIAVTGNDGRAQRRLSRLRQIPPVSLRVLNWTDDIPALMQAASVLVSKPGGLTTAEAAMCALPVVMFDAIPGPEQRNAELITAAGAGVLTNGPRQAAAAALTLLRDPKLRRRMSANAGRLARPDAAQRIARLALGETLPAQDTVRRMTA